MIETSMQLNKFSIMNKSKKTEKIFKLYYFQQLTQMKILQNMIWF